MRQSSSAGSGLGPDAGFARPQIGSIGPVGGTGQIGMAQGRSAAGSQASEGWGQRARRFTAMAVAACLLASPSVGLAGDHTAEVSKESGMGAAAALSSLFYSPVKLVYAFGGLVVGSLAWVFTAGDTEVADKVYVRSLRGTYVITPEILRGEEELVFIGRDPSVMPVEQPKAVATGPVAEAPVQSEESYSSDAYGDVGW